MRKLIFLILLFSSTQVLALDSGFKHGISTFGDLKYPANFTHLNYVDPDAAKGGEIKYATEGTFNSLNPFIIKGTSAAGIDMIFDSLMQGTSDEIAARYGLIASEAKLAADKNSIIFKLRKNARWHNGENITADDVIFSFYTLLEKGHPIYKMIYRDIKEAIKINDHEVKFIFQKNHNRDLAINLSGLQIISKNYYKNIAFDKSTLDAPMGSGPYKVKSIDPGRQIVYERVKDYWGKDLPINKGRYNFDVITYDYYRDNNILVEAFKAGAYDARQEFIARNWANSYNIEKVKNGEIIKKEIKNNLPTGMQAFVFNLRKEKFQNVKLREAISYVFDFEWAQKKIFYNSYDRTKSYFDNSEFASEGLPSRAVLKILQPFKNQIPERIFKEKFILPKNDGSGDARNNLLKAKKILEEQGYFIRDKKLIDPKNNHPLTIEFLVDNRNKGMQMVIAPMIKNLAYLGIKARIRMVDDSQYEIRMENFDYEITTVSYSPSLIPGDEQFAYWHSSQKNLRGGANFAGVDNKVVDNLVEKIAKAKSKEELKSLTKALDLVLLWNFYTIPEYHNQTYRILYKNKFSMPNNPPPYSIPTDTWYMKKDH